MNLRTQIWIDRYPVKWAASLLNLLVIPLGKLLRINHELKELQPKRIVIAKYKGMGSIIQATPLLMSLKKAYPECELVFVSSKSNYSILSRINEVDLIKTLDDKTLTTTFISWIKLVSWLLRTRVDAFLDLEIYSNFSSLTTTLGASKNRIGFYLRDSQYRMGAYTHMMYYNTAVPIMQTYL